MSNYLSIPAETRVALDVSEANRLHRYAQAQAEMGGMCRTQCRDGRPQAGQTAGGAQGSNGSW